mgnify:CR=1 FL=1
MDPKVLMELHTHSRGGKKFDEEASDNGFPSGRIPEQTSRLDFHETETTDGGKFF